jgi:hypothetical protein
MMVRMLAAPTALAAEVLLAGTPDHAAQAAVAHRPARRSHGDPRQPRAAVGLDHHALTGCVVGVARVVPLIGNPAAKISSALVTLFAT